MKKAEKVKTDENILYVIGWILLLLVALLAAAAKLWPGLSLKSLPPCLFHLLTGFYCPGCGGTRAVISLLRGEFLTSFICHPLVLYTAVVGGWFLISQTIARVSGRRLNIGMKYRDGYVWAALVIVIANFIVKNLLLLLFHVDLLKDFHL